MSELRFLADESCDYGVVRALRTAGYDVFAVSDVITRSDDRDLIELASRENRILLTEDKDFGWFVFVSSASPASVILMRFPGNIRDTLSQAVVKLVREQGEQLLDSFAVIQPGYIRIRSRPTL